MDEAAQVVCRMPACKQDAAVLGALLGAYRLRGDVTKLHRKAAGGVRANQLWGVCSLS